jgi:hypothetical protein
MRIMLDAVKDDNCAVVENLHEQHGVALNFMYKGKYINRPTYL